jgi:hypothetical protein
MISFVFSETELLNHEEEYDTFYTAFAALAADYISTNAAHCKKVNCFG